MEMLDSYSFLAEVFSVFRKYKLVSDVVSTSEASVSVTIDSKPSPDFIRELGKYAEVEVLSEKTVICIVGEGICREKDVLVKLFKSVRKYPIRVISQDASPRNITLVVDKADDKKIVKLIHKKLLK
jgi:aspartate kinase